MPWIALLALLLTACSDPSPTPGPAAISMTPSAWRVQYGTGAIGAAPVGWQFAFPTKPSHIDYVTAPVSLNATGKTIVSAGFTVTGNAPVWDYHTAPDNTCGGIADMRLFFQRIGDNMSGNGDMQYYRWWSSSSSGLKLGDGSLSVPLAAKWTSVYGVSNTIAPSQFAAALANIGNIGVTFGGGCFAGHGVWLLSGAATFNMKTFAVQ